MFVKKCNALRKAAPNDLPTIFTVRLMKTSNIYRGAILVFFYGNIYRSINENIYYLRYRAVKILLYPSTLTEPRYFPLKTATFSLRDSEKIFESVFIVRLMKMYNIYDTVPFKYSSLFRHLRIRVTFIENWNVLVTRLGKDLRSVLIVRLMKMYIYDTVPLKYSSLFRHLRNCVTFTEKCNVLIDT